MKTNFENSPLKIGMFILIFSSLYYTAIVMGNEQPHKVTIDGKEYIRMKEWNGRFYQIDLIPCDTVKIPQQ